MSRRADGGRAMTPQQYRRALKGLKLSIYRSGPVLGLSRRTAQRYAQGEQTVPLALAKLLRLCVRLKLDGERLASI